MSYYFIILFWMLPKNFVRYLVKKIIPTFVTNIFIQLSVVKSSVDMGQGSFVFKTRLLEPTQFDTIFATHQRQGSNTEGPGQGANYGPGGNRKAHFDFGGKFKLP